MYICILIFKMFCYCMYVSFNFYIIYKINYNNFFYGIMSEYECLLVYLGY